MATVLDAVDQEKQDKYREAGIRFTITDILGSLSPGLSGLEAQLGGVGAAAREAEAVSSVKAVAAFLPAF